MSGVPNVCPDCGKKFHRYAYGYGNDPQCPHCKEANRKWYHAWSIGDNLALMEGHMAEGTVMINMFKGFLFLGGMFAAVIILSYILDFLGVL